MSGETLAILVACCGALGILILAAMRIIFNQLRAGARHKLDEVRRDSRDFSHGVAGDLAKLKADIPQNYVKREDWIRFGALIDARFEAMRERIEAVRENKSDG